jgi:hypothetical protein
MTLLWPLALLLLVAAPAAADTDCSQNEVNAARKQFRGLYDNKDYAKARDILQPFASDCFRDDPRGLLAGLVLSDLAIAAHNAGDDETCMSALRSYAPDSADYRQRLSELPETLRRAIWFNLTVCTGGCNIVDAECQSIRSALAVQKLDKGGDFSPTACPFPARKGAVALRSTARQCLTILPPERKLKWGDYPQADPRAVCPRLGLLQSEGGIVRKNEIALPKDSWLRDLEICCAKPTLTIAPDGRIRLVPEENPPEGCVTGHRTYVVEEIYTFGRGKLKLIHKVREGVY